MDCGTILMARLPEQLRLVALSLGALGLLGSFVLARLYRRIPEEPGRARTLHRSLAALTAVLVALSFAGAVVTGLAGFR